MSDILRFDTIAKEQNLLSRHCQAGEALILGENALMVNLENAQPGFMCVPPLQKLVIPSGGRWYAVSLHVVRLNIAMSRLMDYSVSAMPDRRFRLGFHGYADADLSHVAGLRELMAGHGLLTADEAVREIYDEIYLSVQRAVSKAFPQAIPEYGDILSAKRRVEQEISASLFPVLYRHGLCMRSDFFIEGFARPYIEKKQC